MTLNLALRRGDEVTSPEHSRARRGLILHCSPWRDCRPDDTLISDA